MYLIGQSMGGHGAWWYTQRNPERWAAVVPICGYIDMKSQDPAGAPTFIWLHDLADSL